MSSVNELKAAVPFREWKNNNPVDHRNKPIDLEDDFALRFAYKNYLDGFINTIQSPLQKKGAVESANRFLVKGFTSQEDLDEAIRRVSEVPYAEQEAEVLENYLELRKNASSTYEDGDSAGELFNALDSMEFGHLYFNELREKQARIETLKPNAAGEQEVLTEPELEYLEKFENPVRLLVESSQEDRLRTKLSDGILNVAIVNGALVTRDIPKEDINAEVDRSIRAGAINPTLRGQVTDLLQNPRKLSIERQNTEEAERLIRSAPRESLLYDTLTSQIRRLRFSHLKPTDGQLHEFLTEDGVPTGKTKPVKGQYNEFVSDNYKNFLEDFRKLYPLRGHVSDAEILNAARSVASGVAIENGVFNFHEKRSILFSGKKTRAEQSAERVKQNVYKDPVTGQTYIHPQLLVAKADFDNLVESKELVFQDVDEDGDRIFVNLDGKEDSEGRTQKDRLLATRKKTLDRMYDNMVDSIYDSTADIRNSWLDHISTTELGDERYKTDKSRGEILGEWLDTENGKNFYNRIGQSILQGLGDLVGAISLVGGKAVNRITPGDDPTFLERTGSDILKGTAMTREANKSIGRMFGQQATYVDDGVQFIAPLAVDLFATGVLAATTSPAGAAAYISAAGSKAGIRSTAKAYAAGLTGGGLRTLLKEAGEESAEAFVDKAIKKKLIKVKPQPLIREGVAKTAEAASAVKLFEAAAKGMRSKRVMFPAMAAPAFLRSAGATYGDMHMLLKGATDADGKPLSAEEIEDRATGTAFLAGLITASTVIGLHSLGRVVGLGDKLGGLETWAARGGTTRGLRAILEKLRGKPYASLGEATKDITNKILKEGFSKMNYTVLKRTGGGVVAESLQEGTDALLNTFARSLGARDTSADDWDRPFLDRAKEGLLGAAYGAGLGALGGSARGVIESRANRGTMKESDEQRVRLELAKDIRKRTVARLRATGSTETANTVEEILAAMDEASPAPKVETDTDTDTKADSQADPQADADEAQEQLDASREEQKSEALASDIKQFGEQKKGSKEQRDITAKLAAEFGTPKSPLSKSPSSEEAQKKSNEQDAEEATSEFEGEARILNLLNQIGLLPIAEELVAVIKDPNKFELSERLSAISVIEQYSANMVLTDAQKDILNYIIHQIKTGITEAQADANVENSTPEQQNAAVEAGNAAQAAAEAAKKTSGTGATVVTPDAKKELIRAFVVGKGMTEEEATIEVEELMSQVRRDPQETEDLARIERDEPVLKQTISRIKNGLDALKERAKQGLPKAYQGGVGEVYFTDKPTQGLIDKLGQRMADKAAVGGRSTDVGTRVAELELLERLKNTLEDLLTLNRRKKELEPEPELIEETPPTPAEPAPDSDIQVASEPANSIRERTRADDGTRDDAAFSAAIKARDEAAKRVALTLKPGDALVDEDGEDVVEDVTPDGRILFKGATDYVDPEILTAGEGRTSDGEVIQIPPPTIRRSESGTKDQEAEKELAELKDQRDKLLDRIAKGEASLLAEELGAKDRTIYHHPPDPIPYDLIRKFARDKRGVFGRGEVVSSPLTGEIIWTPDQTTPLTDKQIKAIADIGYDLEELTVDTRDYYTVGDAVEFPIIFESRKAAEKAVSELKARAKEGLGKQGMTAGSVGFVSTGDPAVLQPKLDRLNKRIARLEGSMAPESGDTGQDSGSPRKDTGIISGIDPKQKAKDELDTLVEEDIEAGALRRGSAKNSTRLMGTAVFGFPSRIKANSTDQKAAADRTYKGVNERYPLVQFDEAGKGLTKRDDVRARLESILGSIDDEQWMTLEETTLQFSKTEIYTIEDTKGGIFDRGNGIGGTGEQVVLFNNDPRAMKVALDQVADTDSILIPKDFPMEKVNPTFRADREGNEPAALKGVVRSVYYPVGDGSGSEVRADGNYTQKRTSSPDKLVTRAYERTNTLLEFIDTGVRIDVSLNKSDPTSVADRVEESITIAQTIDRISAYLKPIIESGDQAPVSNRVRGKFEKDVLKNLYGLDIFAKGRLYAVEVAILQAVANKSTGQTNEEAIMSLFKKGEKDLSGLTKATGKTQSDFANDNELFGFVLSNFLGRGIPAKKDKNIFDVVADYVLGLSRNEGVQTEEGRRTSATPTPDLRTGKAEIDSRLDKSIDSQDVPKRRAESGAPVQPPSVDVDFNFDEGAPPPPDDPNVHTLKSVDLKVDPLIADIRSRGINFLKGTQAEVIRRIANALQEAGVMNVEPAQDLRSADDMEPEVLIERFEEGLRSLQEDWAKSVPDEVRTAQQTALSILGAAAFNPPSPQQGAAAAILYLFKINAMGGDLNPERGSQIVEAAGIETNADEVIKVVNDYRRISEEQNAPNFLDKKFVERIKEMNVQEILELGLENRNVESLINVLKNAGPEHRMAADLLLQFEDYIRTNLTPVTTEAGNHFAGSFNPTTGEVTVNVNGRYGDGVISVVLHEVGHAVFQKIITTPDAELTSGQRAAKKQMQVIYDRARKQWENSKKRGMANRNLDYVFETGRQTVRMVGPSGVVAASGDLPFYAGADETTLDASQAAMKGTAGSDVILPAARGFEEFFTSWLSASDFQDATRRIAIGDRSLFRRIIDAIKTMFGRQTGVEKQQTEVVETIYNFAKMKGSRDLTRSFEATRDSIIKAVQQEVDRVGLTRGLSADLAKRMSEGLVDGPEFDLYNAYLDDFIKAREEGRSGDEEAYLADQVMFTQILKDEVSRQVPTGVRVVFTNAKDLRSRGLGYKAFQPAFTEESTIVEDGVRKRITQINFDLDAMQDRVDLIGDVAVLSATSGPIIDLMSKEGRAKATERFRLAARRVRDEIELAVLEETVHTVDNLVIPDAEKQALLEEVGIDTLVESYKDYLQVSDRFNYLNPETRAKREAEAEPKLQALRDGDPDEVRHALSEMIRMDVQRIVKGTTTESVDAAAIEGLSSPYVTALNKQLTKVAARLGPMLRGERNSNYQQVVQRIVGAMKALDNNRPEDAGFSPEGDPLAGVETLINSFERQSNLFKKATDPESTPEERLEAIKLVRQRQVGQSEAVLKFERGGFSGASTLKGIEALVQRGKIGMQDPRVQELIKKIQLWVSAMEGQKLSDFTVLVKLLKRAYKGGIPDDILVALNTAAGTTDSLDVEPEFKENLNSVYRSVARKIKKEVKDGLRPDTDVEPEALASMRRVLFTIPLEKARVEKVKAFKEKQKIAYKAINDDTELGPEIVVKMGAIRASLDALSQLVSKNYGLSEVRGGKLKMIIDRQSGVYLTRQYKGYDDFAYLEEIQKPKGKFAARRDAAMSYFEELRVEAETKEELAKMRGQRDKVRQKVEFKDAEEEAEAKRISSLSKPEMLEEARIKAEFSVKDSRSKTVSTMNTLLKAIEEKSRGEMGQNVSAVLSDKSPKLKRLLQLDTDALKRKSEIDPRVRYLLGQYGLELNEDGTFEEKGLVAFEQTFTALTRMAEQSSFFSQLKRIGGVVDGDFENAFVFTLQEAIDADLDGSEYTNARTGRLLKEYIDSNNRTDTDGDGAKTVKSRDVFDFTYDMFIPTESFEAFKDYQKLSGTSAGTSIGDGRTVIQLAKEGRYVTAAGKLGVRSIEIVNGLFLVAKTAFNIPAYPLRNMITAISSYGSANGITPKDVARELFILFMSRLDQPFRGGSKISPERRPGSEQELSATEYRMLGLDQRTLEISTINNQLKAGKTKDVSQLFFESLGDVFETSKKSRLGKIKDISQAPFKASYDFVASMAQAIDTATKVAIYKKEKSVLKEAQQYEKDNGLDLGYLDMSEEAMQQLAARKAVSVAPTYSEATRIQRLIRRFNPFIFDAFSGFFVDQARILYNQVLRGTSYQEIKDRNPIIERNGRRRRRTAMLTHGSFAAAATSSVFITLKVLLDRDEEELLEANRPSYARNNSYVYIKGSTLIDMGASSVPQIIDMFSGLPPEIDPNKIYSVDITYINGMSPVIDGSQQAFIKLLAGLKEGEVGAGFREAAGKMYVTYLERFLGQTFTLNRSTGKPEFNVVDALPLGQVPDTIAKAFTGRDPDGRPLFKDGMDNNEKFKAIRDKVILDTLLPSNLEKLRRHYKQRDAEDTDIQRLSEQTLASVMSPLKVREVDPSQGMRAVAYEINRDREAVRALIKDKLKDGSVSYTDEEIEDLARRVIENTVQTDKKLISMIETSRNFEEPALRLTDDQIYNALIKGGVGKNRAKAVMNSRTERYLPTEAWYVDLLKADPDESWPDNRARVYDAAVQRISQEKRYEDVYTGQGSDTP
tara:strand:- start:1008 stop:13712 length:12705 start_codon:yes stop_codon:yes gene_type:complete